MNFITFCCDSLKLSRDKIQVSFFNFISITFIDVFVNCSHSKHSKKIIF